MTDTITWTTERRKIRDLIPWPRNPRQIKGEQVRRLQESVEEFGQFETVAVGPGNEVYNGHQRLKSWGAKYGPDYEVEVRVSSRELTEKEREKLTILAHKGAAGEWDFDTLANEFELPELLEWGFSEKELLGVFPDEPKGDDPGAQIDKAEELREKWHVETGQLWRLGEHRLICGDCTDEKIISRLMNGQKAVLFATDPPYGVAYNDETGNKDGDTIANDENDGPKLQAFLEKCFSAWLPHLEDNAAWYLWHAQLTQGFFAAAAAAADILIHRQIIWVKPSLIMGHGDYHWRHELCFYGWRKGNRPPFYGDRNQTTIWEIGRDKETTHPTEKHPDLWKAPMQNNTKAKQICAEPFCGSGSQIIAGERYGRIVYACDLEPKWCATTIQRWVDMTGGTPELISQVTP